MLNNGYYFKFKLYFAISYRRTEKNYITADIGITNMHNKPEFLSA